MGQSNTVRGTLVGDSGSGSGPGSAADPNAPAHSSTPSDHPTRRGGWTPTLDARLSALESPVGEALGPVLESVADESDRITVVPDAHYPFHPSTGMVTDPAVVGAVLDQLSWRTDADLAVAGVSTACMPFDRTAEYLGYPDLCERTGADLVDLAPDRGETEYTRHVFPVDGRSVAVSVPEWLREDTVLVVPSLRPTDEGNVAGGMRTLGGFADAVAEPALTAVAATRAIEPACCLLDATTVYGDEPYAANALFAGPTPVVDALGASLFGTGFDDRAIELAPDATEAAIGVEPGAGSTPQIRVKSVGRAATDPVVDFEAQLDTLRDRLEGGALPPSDDTHPAVSIAYRLYAAVGGDAVPPQLELRGGS
ncbi:DUF362 family protein [Natrialba magadii ATCC 43099]|uniref:DUF362 family protein n=1 Tax=Natrialba magadii (strain ATCC 43099 / DSM 3394 / CCM 3739 / CIP 104546 / IAM 13178 / JCM 8861 / NBRC 102185 / NCIMB 2190 / MS3) TaxID=547559 RepID=D3SR18_NATMM|nr:DUF362 domain-containing protein [Natrialba magadii]ADD06574.1 DUF362 family protein [Natrialba magadii ATCC 43099]ELY31965.1 hypothetical protein C500_05288 [Natrialba magadii ATCC 43099]